MKHKMVAEVQGTIVIPKENVSPRMLQRYTYIRKGFGGDVEVTRGYYEDDYYYYFGRNLNKFRKLNDSKFEYNLVEGKTIDGGMKEGFALYPHQQEVEDKVLEHFKSDINCLINAPVRFGKSISLTSIITKLKRSTLILVDTTMLVEQLLSDISKYSTLDVGVLEKEGELNDVTVATFQWINKNPERFEEVKNSFGVLAVDECHVGIANTYMKTISSVPSRYRIAMSATPTKSASRLTEALYDLFGEVAVEGFNPNALTARHEFVHVNKEYYPSPYNPKASMRKYLLSKEVGELIESLLKKHEGKTIMIVSDIKQVQTKYSDYAINSDMSKKDRKEIMDKINDGTIKVFSGYGVMLKGVTMPRLEVIIHLFAATTRENLQQLRGRILTPPPDGYSKDPLFIEVQTKNPSWKDCQREKWLKELSET